jgi:hypothetical protein
MSTPLTPRSKTIDNLGIDPSVRYAQDQEYLDRRITKDTSYISSQAQIEVSLPCFSSEFDHIFQTSLRNKEWAAFMNPPGFSEQKKRLFTFQVLPSLGTEETIQIHAQRLKDRLAKEEDKRRKKKKQRDSQEYKQEDAFEEDIQFQEAEQESVKLLRLIEIICNLDKILIEINSRRNQYQKG